MYAAAVHEGKLRVDANAGPRILNGWRERGAEPIWIDLQSPTAQDLAPLRERFDLHPLAVEECDHTGVRPKIEAFDSHLFLVLHGINHNAGEDQLRTVEFKVFLRRGLLITVHDKPSTSIRATQERLQRDPQLLGRAGVDSILHHIVDAVVDHYFPVLERLEQRMEELETEIFTAPRDEHLGELLQLQRQFLALYRILHPQLDILGALSSGRYPEIDPGDLAYFRDVYDHLQRINERVHIAREMISGTMQFSLSQISNRTNAVMKSLALLATVMLPASLFTSFLSMNIEHLPGHRAPETFWIVLSASILATVALVAALRRLRWL